MTVAFRLHEADATDIVEAIAARRLTSEQVTRASHGHEFKVIAYPLQRQLAARIEELAKPERNGRMPPTCASEL